MIRLPQGVDQLTPAERYGMGVLIDLARLVPVDDSDAEVVALRFSERDVDTSIGTCLRQGWHIRSDEGAAELPRAVLRAVTRVAGAEAEQATLEVDRYGRVPPACNELVAAGLEREPVLSLAAIRLREAVRAAAGRRPLLVARPWPEGKRWAVAVTHDVDVVSLWPLFTGLRVSELLRKGKVAMSARAAAAALAALPRNPIGRGVAGVLGAEQAHGVAATWFIICARPTPRTFARGDVTYSASSSRSRRVLAEVHGAGHEIGLHGSFITVERAGAFEEQRAALNRLTGAPVRGIRQHFLRMRPGETQRAMARAGFSYDASFGFSDRNGFRLGVADVIPAWHSASGSELPLHEVPLHWMDRALSKYSGEERPRAWVADALALAHRVRGVEGLWTGLWHPNLTAPLGYPGAPAAFADLLAGLLAGDPYTGTLSSIVEWRERRRRLRITRLAPDLSTMVFADGAGLRPSDVLETA